MDPDYKELCKELFGTYDIEELKKISTRLKNTTARNTGRKRKLSAEQIEQIKKELANGKTLGNLAVELGTSRQVINKYINVPPKMNYTMRIVYLRGRRPYTIIDVDFLNKQIEIQNRTDDLLYRAFGVKEKPTWNDFELFLRERCFPETRGGAKDILEELGIENYDALRIVEKTGGRMVDDYMRMEFRYYTRGESC